MLSLTFHLLRESVLPDEVNPKLNSKKHIGIHIIYSLNNQNNILCYRRFDFTSEVLIRTDFQNFRNVDNKVCYFGCLESK